MSGRGRRGQSRTSAPEAPPERYVEHTLRSEDASMNQPQVEPSRAADPGVGTLTMDQVIQIVTAATRQTRESSEDQRGMIERALKLGAKTYDGIGDPEAAYLWLDRVSEIYALIGCSDEQKVIFSGFLMEAEPRTGGRPLRGDTLQESLGTSSDRHLQTDFTHVVIRMQK